MAEKELARELGILQEYTYFQRTDLTEHEKNEFDRAFNKINDVIEQKLKQLVNEEQGEDDLKCDKTNNHESKTEFKIRHLLYILFQTQLKYNRYYACMVNGDDDDEEGKDTVDGALTEMVDSILIKMKDKYENEDNKRKKKIYELVIILMQNLSVWGGVVENAENVLKIVWKCF